MRSCRRTGSCCLTAAVFVLFALMPASGHAAAWLPQQTVAEGEDHGHALAVAPDGEATVQPPTFTTLKLPKKGTPGVPVAFVAAAVDNRAGVASTRWDFGDGFVANGPAPKHTYQRAGTFLVRVTVTDHAGNSATKSHVIVVT